MARGRYNEQEPELYEDQFGDFYYDPNTGGFVSAPAMSGIGAPEVSYYEPAPTYYAPEPVYYAPEPTYYAPEPVYVPPPEPVYYAPEPVYVPPPRAPEPTYYEPDPVYYAPEPVYVPPPAPEPVYVAPPAPEPVYTPAAVAQVAEPAPPVSGLGALSAPAAAAPAETPFTLTPEMAADVQRLAQLGMSPNAAFGLSSMEPGALSKADPLFEYAKTAPILELKGNKEFETLKFQPLPDTNYKLVVGGKEVATGSTPEQVAALVNAANEISEAGGKMADVRLQKETQYVDKAGVVQNAYADIYANKQNNAGALEFVIPAILAAASAGVLAPAIVPALAASLGISTATAATLAAGLTAAAGTTAGKLALGSSLKDALIQGGISGLTAGVMQGTGLTDAIKGTFGGATSGGASDALAGNLATSGIGTISAPLSEAANEIVVTAFKNAVPSLISQVAPSVVQAGLTGLGNSMLPSQPATTQPTQAAPPPPLPPPSPIAVSPDSEILVNAAREASSGVAAPLVTGIGNIAASLAPVEPATTTAASEGEPLTVTATRPSPSIIPSAVAAVAPPLVTALAPSTPATTEMQGPVTQVEQPVEAQPGSEIVVSGTTLPPVNLSGLGSLPLSVISSPTSQPPIISEPQAPPEKVGDEQITVTGTKVPTTVVPSIIEGVAPSLLDALTPATPATTETREPLYVGDEPMITATASKIPTTTIVPAVIGATIPALTPSLTPSEPATTKADDDLSLKDVIRAGGIVSTVADLVGGGGDGGGGPLSTGVGYTVPKNRLLQRIPATFDPFTYGQKEGEFEFFGDGMAEGGEVDDDMVSHLIAYRKGGGHAGPGPVKGIGSGQEDKIPAWLSDGEYVWSAQDVADLGDGSTDEGVRRLDRMRQMVRKGAGRKDVKKIAKPQRGIQQMLKAVGGAV